jgi:hypothetical protein
MQTYNHLKVMSEISQHINKLRAEISSIEKRNGIDPFSSYQNIPEKDKREIEVLEYKISKWNLARKGAVMLNNASFVAETYCPGVD